MILLFEYLKGHRGTEALRNIGGIIPRDIVFDHDAQLWFRRFREQQFGLDDLPRSGRPSEVDDEQLLEVVEGESTLSVRCCAALLGFSHITVERHLKELGKTWWCNCSTCVNSHAKKISF